MFPQKQKKISKGNRLLISITVLGSPGPIRFLVNEDDKVCSVIEIALKNYAREGRFPVLGSYADNFILDCCITGNEALNPLTNIGSVGVRNFTLFKKPDQVEKFEDQEKQLEMAAHKRKDWFSPKISTH